MYATLESQVKQEHDVDIVLVSVGDMKAIKKAYPNYFWTQINLLKKCRVRSKIYLGFDKIKLNHPRVVLLRGQNGTTIRHQNHSDINYVIGYLNSNHAKAASEGKPLVVLIAPQEKDRQKLKIVCTGCGLISGRSIKALIKIQSICSLKAILSAYLSS